MMPESCWWRCMSCSSPRPRSWFKSCMSWFMSWPGSCRSWWCCCGMAWWFMSLDMSWSRQEGCTSPITRRSPIPTPIINGDTFDSQVSSILNAGRPRTAGSGRGGTARVQPLVGSFELWREKSWRSGATSLRGAAAKSTASGGDLGGERSPCTNSSDSRTSGEKRGRNGRVFRKVRARFGGHFLLPWPMAKWSEACPSPWSARMWYEFMWVRIGRPCVTIREGTDMWCVCVRTTVPSAALGDCVRSVVTAPSLPPPWCTGPPPELYYN